MSDRDTRSNLVRLNDVLQNRSSTLLPSQPTVLSVPSERPAEVCPDCAGAGFLRYDVEVGHPLFGKIQPCKCREDEIKRKRAAKLVELSGMHAATRRMSFDSYRPQTARQRDALALAQEFAARPNNWLYLYGQYGCGKTHLLTAIAWQLIDAGTSVLYVVVPDLLARLRQTFDGTAGESFSERIQRIQDADVLLLDDLGTEQETAWVREQMFSLINDRYLSRKPMVVSSNYTPTQIGGRIGSRLDDRGLVAFIGIDAGDFRKEPA